VDYSRWMSLNTKIHNKKLANICLPMSHDTGTFDLGDTIVDPALAGEIEKIVYDIAKALGDILPYNMNPVAWLLQEAVAAVKGLATATKKNCAEQLDGGMRGFDFRMYNDAGTYYTYHGLKSTSTFASMVDDIRFFLEKTSDPSAGTGEIVYMNMSHYLGFDSGAFSDFGDYIIRALGPFAYRSYNGGANDPFNATYSQIIGQDGLYKSRVILVSEEALDATYFWPVNYCPPVETRDENVLVGKYTNSTDLPNVITTQVSQFQSAVSQGLPFANYMTMTPNGEDYTKVVVSSLYGALGALAADLLATGHPVEAAAVKAVAIAFHTYNIALPWTKLEQLEEQIDKQMPELVDDNFLPDSPETNAISMIFCDFWENSEVVDLAIALSNDFEMEWTGNSGIKYNGNQLKTTEGPTAAAYQGTISMIYKRSDNDEINMAVYSPDSGTWISDQKIKDMPGGSFDPKTDKSPSAAVYNDLLYMVWKSNDSDSIRYAWWNGTTWTNGGVITIDSPGQNPETNNSPYLAPYKDMLALVHKYKDADDIHFSTFNGTWSGGNRIEVVSGDDTTYPGTNKRPAIVEYDGLLYLIFKGGHTNNLLQCTYDGTSWSGNADIKNSDESFKPKSDEGPGLARFAGSIQMVYKGEGSNDVWYSFFDGNDWGGNDEMKDLTDIEPKSNRSPWLVRDGLTLYLLNKNDNDDLMQSMFAPVTF